ncbi:hypothetical protein [Promicromonospora sp. NPDC057488]|uniref:hypothetical protein n=1 Tax=Promicromonospora sp. NPDC057488 TaxID=3346147 RepID=UPI00366DD562
MTNLLIHPSRGAKDGRENLKRSLDKQVDISDAVFDATLTTQQKTELLRLHPDGQVRFWGTYDTNRDKIERIHEGDAVIFTGQGAVWAIGAVGFRFENDEFAQALWLTHPEKGAYQHVYSLSRFEEVQIPYEVLNGLLGYKEAFNFRRMLVHEGDTADRVIEELGIQLPTPAAATYIGRDDQLAEELESDPKRPLQAIESLTTHEVVVTTTASTRVILRGENALVQAYAATLPDDVKFGRTSTAAGVTDLQVVSDGTHELIEAKSAADTRCVRQVLAQLLHYATSAEPAPDVVSGLFPERPNDSLTSLLHSYGIDVLFRVGVGEFTRVPAPATRRELLRGFWV